MGAFNKEQFLKNLAALAKLLPLILPLFAADQPQLMLASGETPDPDKVADDLFAAVSAPEIDDGKMGGPVTEALLEEAIAALGALIASNAALGAKVVVSLIGKIMKTP